MKHSKRIVLVALIAVLSISSTAVYAQGNGRGPNNNPPIDDTVLEPQGHAYQHGGIGFVNPNNGNRWDDRERGNMRQNQGGNSGLGMYAQLPPAVEGELSEETIALMTSGWLDEQHAYAVYQSVINQFGEVAPFVNIQRAEAQHAAAWELLFERYDVALPELPTFTIPEFDSVADACQIAADAEIANFGLYDEMLAGLADYPDMVQVVTALRNASEFNHLPAFETCAG